ncbi:hypothetical protein [Asticcacaulis benevestitus]|uniref:hypothetical protein n=1 Tax=Asticcacaulis benevestitus TaxID=347481 RepID=UPI00138ADE52|nr:hypothetical protein [Asticcacaulis benevestitus]
MRAPATNVTTPSGVVTGGLSEVIAQTPEAKAKGVFVCRHWSAIFDGLFDVAELRLGEKPQAIVRIAADRKGGARHD